MVYLDHFFLQNAIVLVLMLSLPDVFSFPQNSFDINLFNALHFVCMPHLRMKYVFIKIFLVVEAKEIV